MCQNLAFTVLNVPNLFKSYLPTPTLSPMRRLPPTAASEICRWRRLTVASSVFAVAFDFRGCRSNKALQIRPSQPASLDLPQPGSFPAKSCSFRPKLTGCEQCAFPTPSSARGLFQGLAFRISGPASNVQDLEFRV